MCLIVCDIETSTLRRSKPQFDIKGNLTLYVPCIMFQCADEPKRCNTSYE